LTRASMACGTGLACLGRGDEPADSAAGGAAWPHAWARRIYAQVARQGRAQVAR